MTSDVITGRPAGATRPANGRTGAGGAEGDRQGDGRPAAGRPGGAEEARTLDGWPVQRVAPGEWLAACRRARDERGLNFLAHLSAVHRIDEKEIDLLAYAYAVRGERAIGEDRLCLATTIPDTVGTEVESVASVWPTAAWHEREVWDMFGVRFRSHPDLRRILMAEDYGAHPLRKDFEDRKPNLGVSRETLAKDAGEKEPVRESGGEGGGESSAPSASAEPRPGPEAKRADGGAEAGDGHLPANGAHVPPREAPGSERVDGPPDSLEKLEDGTKFLELSMGPQHPSTHGVLRLAVRLDGEEIVDLKVDIGYLHRSFEKFAETWQYPQLAPFVDRNDYLAGTLNEFAYCLAAERLLDIKVPERAEYIRVIMAELNRIGSHLIWFGTFALDLGATTPFLWAFEQRERIYDLNEVVTGGRIFPQFFRLGGVRNDFPDEFFPLVEKTLSSIEASVEEYDRFLSRNPIFRARTRGIGVISAEEAIAYGCSGAMLRGSGVPYDVRKADPYSIYPAFAFDVPVGERGDVYDRYLVRLREILESVKIVRQALRAYPRRGEILAKLPRRLKPPPGGRVYAHVESARGDLGCLLVSDGTDQPYRLKWRAPSFSNLQAVERIAPGLSVADLVALVGSVDIVLGEVDR